MGRAASAPAPALTRRAKRRGIPATECCQGTGAQTPRGPPMGGRAEAVAEPAPGRCGSGATRVRPHRHTLDACRQADYCVAAQSSPCVAPRQACATGAPARAATRTMPAYIAGRLASGHRRCHEPIRSSDEATAHRPVRGVRRDYGAPRLSLPQGAPGHVGQRKHGAGAPPTGSARPGRARASTAGSAAASRAAATHGASTPGPKSAVGRARPVPDLLSTPE